MNLTNRPITPKNQKRIKGKGKAERESPWFEYGTDKQFLEWLSHQPSVIDKSWNQRNPDRNIACHYRKQRFGAGGAIKPKFCALPMTHDQHMLQEKYGWGAVVNGWLLIRDDCHAVDEWIEKQIKIHLEAWVKNILK